MAYTKHTWVDDELITADKLNNIENGIETLANPLMASGELADGDIISVQTADGSFKKLKYRKIEMSPPFLKDFEGPGSLPAIDSSVDKETLYQLVFSGCASIKYSFISSGISFPEAGIIITSVVATIEEATEELPRTKLFQGAGFSISFSKVMLYIDEYNNQYAFININKENGDSFSDISVVVSGFVPVEE